MRRCARNCFNARDGAPFRRAGDIFAATAPPIDSLLNQSDLVSALAAWRR
jgi:hypothetical protein